MAVDKMSFSFEPEVADAIREAAEAEGTSASAWVRHAVLQRLKLDLARQTLREWEAELGAVSDAAREAVLQEWPEWRE